MTDKWIYSNQAGTAERMRRPVHVADEVPGMSPLLPVERVATRLYGAPDGDRAACERVRWLIRTKRLKARKVGKRWYVHRDHLDAFERAVDDPDVMRHPAGRVTV